jgi:hypothetical protein
VGYSPKLRQEAPSGIQDDPIDIAEVQFSEFTGLGIDTIVPMPEYDLDEQGTYWFDVLLGHPGDSDGQLLTRIPFTLTYRQTVTLRRPD